MRRRRRRRRRSSDDLEQVGQVLHQRPKKRDSEGAQRVKRPDILNWQQNLGNRQTTRMLESRSAEFDPDKPLPDEGVRFAEDGAREAETGDLQADRFKDDAILEAVHDGNRLVRRGNSGDHVRKIQQGLMDAGHAMPLFGADTIFGSETRSAVISFQKSAGLSQDGIVGPKTMGALDDHHAGGAGPPKVKPVPPATHKATLAVTGDDSYVDNATESRKNVKFNVAWTGGKQDDYVVVNWLQGHMKKADGTFFKVKMYDSLVDFNFGKWQVDSVDKDPVYWSDDKNRWRYKVDSKSKFHATDSPGPMFDADGKGAQAKVEFKVAVYKSSDVQAVTSGQITAKPIHEFQPWTYHVEVLGGGKFKHNL